MSTEFPGHIVIVGDGIAAICCAMRLLQFGLRPVLLSNRRSGIAGVEAVPVSAMTLFEEIGLANAVVKAGGELVEGFDNYWDIGRMTTTPGSWIHIERRALAKAARNAVLAAGIDIRAIAAEDSIQNARSRCKLVIDATGRSAILSRPVERRGADVATLFTARRDGIERARVARVAECWGYAIPWRELVSIGVVGRPVRSIPRELAEALGLSGPAVLAGRRPAFPQRSLTPLSPGSMAIGDAALAHSPLAGQGIRFAMHSAFAAAAVARAIQSGSDEANWASDYYTRMLEAAWARHVAHLERAYDAARESEPVAVPQSVRFVGRTRVTGVLRESAIVREEAVELTDGSLVRWLGGADLLVMRDLAKEAVPVNEIVSRFGQLGFAPEASLRIVRWCVQYGVLA